MYALASVVLAAPVFIGLYAYAIYPAILWIIARSRRARSVPALMGDFPSVTLTLPVYNAACTIRSTLERLMELDYPREKLQILVLSDASTDGTDDIVRSFSSGGVQLVRAAERRGKTAAENAAVPLATGEIIVNIDATVGVPADSLKKLVAAFNDPSVGVASGRDVSVRSFPFNVGGEAGYVGYEMWVRALETAAGSIVGASGCFFGIRKDVHDEPIPPELSWDFASTLVARQKGYRSVSVADAVCLVPSTDKVSTERARKSRTMARGLSTLFHFRALMNPFKYGGFALMLISHKLMRWLPYLLVPAALVALALLATESNVAGAALVSCALVTACGFVPIRFPRAGSFRLFRLSAFVVATLSAGFLAWFDALRGERKTTWNPTPRPAPLAP